MRVYHRLSLSVDEEIQQKLLSIGIDIEIGFNVIEIDEDSSMWIILKNMIDGWHVVDIVDTKFTKTELDNADYLQICPSWHCGYPMPDDNFEYLNVSFDLSNYSRESGIVRVQKSPIRIKGEPKWGKKHIMQLNWIFDIYFVRPEIWENIFKQFKIETMPVIHYRKNTTLDSVLQLVPQGTVSLDMTGYPYETCLKTGIKKYLPVTRGFFPAIIGECRLNFMLSNEFFGSGASAFNAAIISNALYKEIIKNKIKGVSFVPLKRL